MKVISMQKIILLSIAATALLCACKSGPDYKRPDTSDLTPRDWRWKIAEPMDDRSSPLAWHIFDDAELTRLENDALARNESLKAADARVRQAYADLRESRSGLFPSVSANAYYQHQRLSGNRPMQINMPVEVTPMDTDAHSLSADLTYELDLWGRVRRSNEAGSELLRASECDVRTAVLSVQTDVANDYFSLRGQEEQIAILKHAVDLREKDAGILQERFQKGLIPEIDAARAKTELAQAKADLADAERQKEHLVNALAILCGRAPSQIEVRSETPLGEPDFKVPETLPSALLEHRPDVAAAERRLVASNARIGVARAAYFPSVNLVGSVGYLSADANDLLTSDSATWSIMPKVSVPLFTAGRTQAEVEKAKASYDEAVSTYRLSVLTAFKDVEDALADIANLTRQAKAQKDALDFARQTESLARARYAVGYVDYMTVADAERATLAQELACAQVRTERYTAFLALDKALGGSPFTSDGRAER